MLASVEEDFHLEWTKKRGAAQSLPSRPSRNEVLYTRPSVSMASLHRTRYMRWSDAALPSRSSIRRTASGRTSPRDSGFAVSHLRRPRVSSGSASASHPASPALRTSCTSSASERSTSARAASDFSRKSMVRFLGWAAATRIARLLSGEA
jgi:hypothetical protein